MFRVYELGQSHKEREKVVKGVYLCCFVHLPNTDRFQAHCRRVGEGQGHWQQGPVNDHRLFWPQRQGH